MIILVKVIITEMKEKPNIITLRSIACNIFQIVWPRKYAHSSFSSLVQSLLPKNTLLRTYVIVCLTKPEGHEIQKLRVIETAAKLIQTDIKAVET